MRRQENARPALWLISSRAARPPVPGDEPVWVEGEGLRLTRERLEVAGRAWSLEALSGFTARREAPGLLLPLGLGGLAALLVPALLLQPRSFAVTAALVVATLLVFSAIAWLVAAEETYWLLVRTADGEHRVWRCRDPQLFARVERALGEALAPRVPARPVRRLVLVR